ncbi:MAG: hypothetical protein ACK4K0_07745 [Flavobacteriales bacterium]
MDWLVNPIGEFLVWSFGPLEKLENLPNIAFLLLGFVGLGVWLRMQAKFNREAANNPNQIK